VLGAIRQRAEHVATVAQSTLSDRAEHFGSAGA
jgi:hypothetical protein